MPVTWTMFAATTNPVVAATPAVRDPAREVLRHRADIRQLDVLTTDPTRPSGGVRHLLVGGTFVIRDGTLDLAAYPGRAVRGEPR